MSGNETNYAMRTHTTHSFGMPLSCYDQHRKPVCDKYNAGYYCTKCCKCQNRKRGRPRKVSIEQPETAVRSKLRMEDTVTVHLEAPPDFSITGAIDQTASMYLDYGDTPPYATELFCWLGPHEEQHAPRTHHKGKNVIHECWRAGENKELGKLKISAAGVYDRLEEMQLQKTIRLSELPLPGIILAVYKSIGSKPQAPSAGSYKRGRPLSNAGVSGRKKAKVCYSDCDMQKDLSKWNKQELRAYLIHHSLKKKKPDLLLHIRQHMDTD